MAPHLELIDGLQTSWSAMNGSATKLRENIESGGKSWIVQKFGGTSIGKFAANIAENIVRFVFP